MPVWAFVAIRAVSPQQWNLIQQLQKKHGAVVWGNFFPSKWNPTDSISTVDHNMGSLDAVTGRWLQVCNQGKRSWWTSLNIGANKAWGFETCSEAENRKPHPYPLWRSSVLSEFTSKMSSADGSSWESQLFAGRGFWYEQASYLPSVSANKKVDVVLFVGVENQKKEQLAPRDEVKRL